VLPDGCADFLFDLAQPDPRAQWVGTMTRAIRFELRGHVDLFGARFEPGGLHALTGQPLDVLTDLAVDAAALRSPLPDALTGELLAADDLDVRCRVMNRALLALLPAAGSKLTPLFHVEAIEPSLPFWVGRLGFTKTIEVPSLAAIESALKGIDPVVRRKAPYGSEELFVRDPAGTSSALRSR
jgi:hypothetical protein